VQSAANRGPGRHPRPGPCCFRPRLRPRPSNRRGFLLPSTRPQPGRSRAYPKIILPGLAPGPGRHPTTCPTGSPSLRTTDTEGRSLRCALHPRKTGSVQRLRKSWLFVGSDGHAESSGHILSLVASSRLHDLDPEAYLRDLFRALARWPRDRFLELAPKYWAETRTRLDPRELAAEVVPLTVPRPSPRLKRRRRRAARPDESPPVGLLRTSPVCGARPGVGVRAAATIYHIRA
jgi:hypothetical protein